MMLCAGPPRCNYLFQVGSYRDLPDAPAVEGLHGSNAVTLKAANRKFKKLCNDVSQGYRGLDGCDCF